MIDENPYSPLDPHWHVGEAYLRKKREREINKEIMKLFIASRKRQMHIIITTPKMRDRRLIRK